MCLYVIFSYWGTNKKDLTYAKSSIRKDTVGSSKMTQCISEFSAKAEHVNSVSRVHMVEVENKLPQGALSSLNTNYECVHS